MILNLKQYGATVYFWSTNMVVYFLGWSNFRKGVKLLDQRLEPEWQMEKMVSVEEWECDIQLVITTGTHGTMKQAI